MDEDCINFSYQKLKLLLEEAKSEDEAIKNYIKTTNFTPVDDFDKGLEWFNVGEPLSLSKHLKGKIVIFDFFTYCCINCMHILPDLRDLENEFSIDDGLVVVGVHSAKFENEKNSKNILAAVQRYNISHPVVNDYQMTMWKNCEVHCWPTLLILGPSGNPLIMFTGEGHKEIIRLFIKNSLEYYKVSNEISDHKLPLKSAFHLLSEDKGYLLFPGKITSYYDKHLSSDILAVSDTGNHRIFLFKSDGTLLTQIGNGTVGFKDGNLEETEFNSPQGLVFDGKNTLYVADTENHAIRKIELEKKNVETIAGIGVQGNDRKGGKPGKSQEISSPWDLCIYNVVNEGTVSKVLIIAMAGLHQVWAYFLQDTIWWKGQKHLAGTCIRIAGSGREENRNNQYPHTAAFAQPSGLAIHNGNKEVYIADSESSSVRRLSLIDGKVTAVVGGDKNPNNLFAFGDKDGKLQEAKLQHLLGLAMANDNDFLFVADTYNHKIKKVDIKTNTAYTLPITDLKEPGGLCVGFNDKKLYIADTNNHLIKVATLDDKLSVINFEKLELRMVHDVSTFPKISSTTPKFSTFDRKTIVVSEEGGILTIRINVNFVKGLKLNPKAVQKWSIKTPNTSWSVTPSSGNNINNIVVICKVLKIDSDDNDCNLNCIFNIVACTEELCIPKNFVIRQGVNFQKYAPSVVDSMISVDLDPFQISLKDL